MTRIEEEALKVYPDDEKYYEIYRYENFGIVFV